MLFDLVLALIVVFSHRFFVEGEHMLVIHLLHLRTQRYLILLGWIMTNALL